MVPPEGDVIPGLPRRGLGAGDGVRTRDTELGKLVLYQLSYARSRQDGRMIATRRDPVKATP
jgi:hypothetical protein